MTVKLIYDSVGAFSEGLCAVQTGYAWNYIDTEGNVVIPFDYIEISQVSTGIIAAYSNVSGWNFFAKVTVGADNIRP